MNKAHEAVQATGSVEREGFFYELSKVLPEGPASAYLAGMAEWSEDECRAALFPGSSRPTP